MHLIAITNLKCLQLLFNFVGVITSEIQGQHCALLMHLNSLHLNVAQRGRRQDSNSQFEHLRKRRLVCQFIHCWTAHHAIDRYLWSHGGNLQCVAILKPLQIRAHAVQQQIIGVHLLN